MEAFLNSSEIDFLILLYLEECGKYDIINFIFK